MWVIVFASGILTLAVSHCAMHTFGKPLPRINFVDQWAENEFLAGVLPLWQ